MIRLRKSLFVLFTFLYLIICPSLILYSLGIVIKPGKKNMIKTGVVYIATIPSGASITVNDKPHKDETPTLIDNLMPGSYHIRIKAPGYQLWETTLSVSAEKATPLENILLIKESMKPDELSVQPVNKLLAVDENPFVIVTAAENTQDYLFHIWDESIRQNILPERKDENSLLKPLFPRQLSIPKGRILNHFAVTASPYLIFEIETDFGRKYLWTDLIFGPSKTEDITNLFPVNPQSIQWSQNDPRHLYSLQDHTINRLDMATKAIYPGIIENVENFSTYNQIIYFISSDKTLLRANTNDLEDTVQPASNSQTFNDLIIKQFPFTTMWAASEHIVFLIGKNGTLLSNLKPYLISEKNIKGFKWHKKFRKLAFWNSKQIGIMDFSKKNTDEIPTVAWINVAFKEISQVYWANEDSHLLIADDGQIYLADIQCCETQDIRKIVEIQPRSNVYFSNKTGKVFYISKETSRLSSLDIIPQHTLISAGSTEKKALTTEEEK